MCQDKDSLTKQKQRLHAEAKENRIFILYFHFLGSRPSVYIAVALEDQHHNKECPPLLLVLCFNQSSYGMEFPLGLPGPGVLATNPSKSCPPPGCYWRRILEWQSWHLCELCSAIATTLMCYQHTSHYFLNTKHSMMKASMRENNSRQNTSRQDFKSECRT